MRNHIFIFAFAIAIFGSVFLKAQDNVDPDSREQIEAAKKNAEKMGVKMPDIDKMMAEDAEENAAAKKEVANKAAPTKPEPLASLPLWIPPIDGFQSTTGSGKHWIDKEGKERGTMRGTVPGDPHAVFKNWEKSAKPKFSGGDTALGTDHRRYERSTLCELACFSPRHSRRRFLRRSSRDRIRERRQIGRNVYLHSTRDRLCGS